MDGRGARPDGHCPAECNAGGRNSGDGPKQSCGNETTTNF
nr:MAG TPA: hypothetical protein [Caudoviricetes sp.]